MLKIRYLFMLIVIICSCNNDNEFSPENLDNILAISVENDNAVSDGVEAIKVIAEFPIDFTTETDGIVDFVVFKDTNETYSQAIELAQENGIQKKRASILVKHNEEASLKVKATISVNGVLISEEVFINFSKAYFNSINITTSSLTITPSSFNEIDLTTELVRNKGVVSLNCIAETVVKDTLWQPRGIFNNYKNKTNSEGKIINKYTLGNDDYQGELFVISTATGINNETKSDTLTIYAQK
ncbi:hypothetical protein [Flavivirga spongiicola]|uniref:Uncharacterized protein n=1 Tax=Flavivirga spongiicola TaxID=421621 RepID=A0ABU7Y0F2_9FLAO|nr:hypothetical protein [Flavivirga sp. MEBiC05379]MDO5980599.1 hypothetical protein [Flavivirga sp. MEBiC05379]